MSVARMATHQDNRSVQLSLKKPAYAGFGFFVGLWGY